VLINFTIIFMFIRSFHYLLPFWKIATLSGVLIEMVTYLAIGLSNPGVIPRIP
jgi:hypothetical protein